MAEIRAKHLESTCDRSDIGVEIDECGAVRRIRIAFTDSLLAMLAPDFDPLTFAKDAGARLVGVPATSLPEEEGFQFNTGNWGTGTEDPASILNALGGDPERFRWRGSVQRP